jgi:BREX protein BrxB
MYTGDTLSDPLDQRLNKVLEKITSDEFLSGSGIGNEIGFYIFDYPPEEELRVREHICFLLDHIPKVKPGLQVRHINLFEFVLDYLQNRNLLSKALQMQRETGDEALKKALAGPLHENKLASVFAEVAQPQNHGLILVSGAGSVWPMLRSHTLLNNLHPIMGNTPLVMFYPGRYDGQSLRLFSKLKNDNYYRAFKLVP